MRDRYPVVAQMHDGSGDTPPGLDVIGIFDARGYWYREGTAHYLQFLPEYRYLAEKVAMAINAAYEAGQRDAKFEIRVALGLGAPE